MCDNTKWTVMVWEIYMSIRQSSVTINVFRYFNVSFIIVVLQTSKRSWFQEKPLPFLQNERYSLTITDFNGLSVQFIWICFNKWFFKSQQLDNLEVNMSFSCKMVPASSTFSQWANALNNRFPNAWADEVFIRIPQRIPFLFYIWSVRKEKLSTLK